MRREQLYWLSEDELAMLLYVVNNLFPIRPPAEISVNLLPTIKHDALITRLQQAEKQLNDTGKPIYQSLFKKLDINYVPTDDS